MEMSIPDIESEYGIYPHSIAKSKYFYIINSGGKSYRLYPFVQGEENAERLFELNTAMCKNGVSVCRMLRTKDGSAFSALDGQLFILTVTPKGREPEPEGEEFLKCISLTAAFHKVLRGFEPPEELVGQTYAKGTRILKHIRGIVNRKNKLSEVDKIFCENYKMMCDLAENASETKALKSILSYPEKYILKRRHLSYKLEQPESCAFSCGPGIYDKAV